LFVISIGLVAIGFIKIEAFTANDSEYFTVNIEMPQGTQLQKTDEVVRKVEDVIRDEAEITNYTSSIGSSSGSDLGSGGGSENKAFVYANLTKPKEREKTSSEIIQKLNSKLKRNITEASFSFSQEESGPPGGEPVDLRVIGNDLLILEELSEKIKLELEQISGVISIDTSVDFSPGEVVFIPNKELLTKRGLTVSEIGLELNRGISRDRNLKIDIEDGEEIAIDLGYDKNSLNSIESVGNILITSSNGQQYALAELGQVELQAAFSSIYRQNEERVISVTADVKGVNVGDVNKELQKRIDSNIEIPNDYRIDFGGENEDTMEAFQDMFLKMIIGIISILFILVIQFNSYKQVFIILSTIPLAMIGVFFGMGLAGLTMDFPAFIGVISLVGIIVNNAIILIDQINKELARGELLIEATRRAGYIRMRPIILTSITTIMGLLPLSITEPIWRNMGFTIIFGLIFGTFLTLFVVPATTVSLYHKKIK
jgi:HAE1 family hydrophobic/amphiphilic exporter-1